MSKIFKNLLVGGFEESFDRSILLAHNVTHILNVASELNVVERVGRQYMKCGVEDDDANGFISAIFDTTNEYIARAIQDGGCVFVHCLEGKSRSVCVCLAYMVRVMGYNFEDALAKICEKRNIDIFPLYLSQTIQYCMTGEINPCSSI